jgi:hypothetical protein
MTRSNDDDSEDTGRGFFRQVGDALTGIVPGVAYMGRDLVVGGLAPVRATRDFVTGKTSGTDAILGGLPFVDQALDLLGNDAAERRQQQYKPFAAGLDQSVKATGTRLRNPTQYRKAWRDGRIVDVILEDAGNLAGAGSLASKGLTAGARTASLGADAAVAGGNAAQAARMAARADRFGRAAGRAERVATLGNKVSDGPIRVSTSLARRGLRGLGTGIDSTLAAMRNSGENSRPQRAAGWADRRFPTMSTPEGRAVTREGRRVNVTEKRRRSGAIRNILNAAPDELTVPEQGVATALRAGTIDQLIRAADTEVPFTAEGIPAEMGVGIPARPDATSLGRDAARTVVAPRQIPEVTLTGDVAELAAAYRDGTMPAEQRARIDKYAEVVDENLADIQERALVGQGRTKGGLDPQQLGDVAIPEYVDKAIREGNPQAAGLGLLIDDRWVPYEQLKELADVDQGVADLVDTTMQRDGLAGFVYPSDMDAFNQALNSPDVYPAAWRPQIEMANRARAGVLESSLQPIMDRIAALKDMMDERAALRNAARQELAALRNRVTAEVDDAIAQVGDPELLQIHSDLNAVNRELRGLRAQFREAVGTRRNNDKLLNVAEQADDVPAVTLRGEQVASGQGRIDSVRTDIAIAEARRDALLDERNARLDAEQEARIADLEDQVDAIDEANGEAPAPKPKRRKRTTDEKNQIEALRLRQRVLDNIGRSQTVRLGRLGATVTNVTRAATPDIAAAIPNTPSDMLAAGLPKPGYVPAGVSDLIDPKRVGTGRRPDRYGIPGIRKPRSENMRASSEELPYSARGMADLIGQEAGQTAANMDVHRIFSDGRLRNVGQILGQTAADLRAKADAEAQAQGGTPAQIAERAKVLYGRAVTEALAEQGFEPLIGDRLAPQHGDFNPDKKIEFDQVGDETVVLPAGLRERLIPYMTGKEMGPFMNTLERLNGKIKGVLLPFSVKWYMGDLVGGAFMSWVGGGIPPNQLFDGMQKIGDLSEEGTRAIFDHPDFQDAGLNFEESARMRNLTERPAPTTGPGATAIGRAWYRAGDVRRASYRLNGSINRINRQGYVLAKLQQLLDERGLDLDLGDVDRAEWQRPGIQAAITDAVEDANKIMGTFDDMTPFERRYIRNIFPFYAWNRHITKLAWRTAIDNPARMVWTMRIGTYGQDPNDPMNDLPWLRGGLSIGNKIMPTNFINPFNDIAGGSIYTPGGALKATSPALKMLALGVGRDPNNELASVTRPYDGKGLGPTGKDGGFRPLTPAEFGYNALRQFAPGRALFNVLPTNEIAGVGLGPHPRYGSGALIVDKRGRPIDQSSRWQSLYGLVSAGGTDGAIPFITDREDIEPILAARAKRLEEAQRRASNTIRFQP